MMKYDPDDDSTKIPERGYGEPVRRRVIYLIHEETRYGEDDYDMNVPDDIEMSFESFYFDTKGGMLEVEDVKAQVERLVELLGLVHDPVHKDVLGDMIARRNAWLTELADDERREQEAEAQAKLERLQKARELLYEAGELPRP